MCRNVFRREFGMRIKSVAAWTLAIEALLFLFMALFPVFAGNTELLARMLANFPKELLTAFGMEDVAGMATVPGYFGFVFLFVQICLAIQAAACGFGLVSVEERERTADFLLSKPATRSGILAAKSLAALAGLTVTNLAAWGGSFLSIALFRGDRPYGTRPLLVLLSSIAVFQLFFFSVGLLVSLLAKRIRSVTPYAMALGFGMYVLGVFGDMLGESALELVTPFRHFDAGFMLEHGTYDLPAALLSVAAILVSLAGSWLLYVRRDIPAVS